METAPLLGSATSTPTSSPQKSTYSVSTTKSGYTEGDVDDELNFTENQQLLNKPRARKDSTAEIFKLANQSMDEILNEIQSKSPGINLYSSEVSTSPLTEPLFAKKEANENDVKEEGNSTEYEEGNTTEEIAQNGAFETSLLRSDSMNFLRKKSDSSVTPLTFTGPRTFSDESPTKKNSGSPKRVLIELSPPKVIHYEQEEYLTDEEISYEGEEGDIAEVSQSDFIWEAVPIKINDPKVVGRPLPPIQHSTSDYSINSLPNLPSSKSNLLESPLGSRTRGNSHSDYENDDSEETVVMSPISNAKISTEDYSKAAQEFMAMNQKISTDKNLKALLEASPTKGRLEYDHDQYLESSKRGELKESKDIVKNRNKRENFINELTISNPLDNDTSEQDEIIADLGDLYDQNIRNTKHDGSLFLNRNDSVKSQMSIASVDRKLKTTIIKKKMDNIELKDGIKGFSDNIVEELIDGKHKEENIEIENDEEQDSGNEQDIEGDDTNNNDDSVETSGTIEGGKGHTRKSSLSDTMGRFFDSMKRSFSGKDLSSEAETIILPKSSNNDYNRNNTRSIRNFSAQSAATSVTNDSDFVSAEEDFDEDSEDESVSQIQEFKSAIHTQTSFDTTDNQADETFHDDEVVSSDAEEDSASIHTLEHEEVKAIDEKENVAKESEVVEVANTSTVSSTADKSADSNYFLDVPKFDDDPYEFSRDFEEFGLDNSNPSSRKTSSGSHSSGGGGGKRISSSESSPLSEVSAIWQKQPDFQNLHRTAPSFQSICDPTTKKQFVFVDSHPKSISVAKHQSTISTFSTRSISISSNSGSVRSHRVNKLATLPSSDEIQITNPLNEDTTDLSGLANSTSIAEEESRLTEENANPSTNNVLVENEVVADEDNEVKEDSVVIEEPSEIVAEEPVHESTVQTVNVDDSLSNVLNTSHNLSDIIKNADDSDFLKWDIDGLDNSQDKLSTDKIDETNKEVKDDEKPTDVNEVLGSPLQLSNDNDVLGIWRTGTITKPKGHSHHATNTSMNNDGVELPYLSVDDMEKFMIHKRMASDEYQIKKVNNNVILHDNSFMDSIGQKGLMINFNNDSSNNVNQGARSVMSDGNSMLIPELGISRGVNDVAKDDVPSVVAVETDDIFENYMKSPSASFSLSNNKYGDLVPDSRRKVIVPEPAASIEPVVVEEEKKIVKSMLTDAETPSSEVLIKKEVKPQVELINGEQGRLFLRLLGLNDIRIPSSVSPSKQKLQICISIDNGVHCITGDWYNVNDVKTTIPINKEFELIVGEKLDLILTLKLRYEKYQNQLVEVIERKKVKSKSLISRCFGMKDELITTKYVSQPAKSDELSNYIANDGSFAKICIKFDDYKERINCKSIFFKMDGINEYGTYKDILSGKLVPTKPNKVLSLDLNMMYIPRKSEYEAFPKSIKDAYDQLHEVNKSLDINHEGYLYQEGGDVEVWQRRYFKLQGTDLLAFNEHSMKLRAKINLKKVVEIIYPGKEDNNNNNNNNISLLKDVEEDESNNSELKNSSSIYSSTQIGEFKKLQPPPGILLGGKKNSSITSIRQFSETLILNEGFKIRFSNGETIDFGADTKKSKLEWCELLNSIISRNQFRRQPWVKSMIKNNPNVY